MGHGRLLVRNRLLYSQYTPLPIGSIKVWPQVSILEKDGIFYLILENASAALFLLKKSVCHFSILVLWTVLFVEVECTLYSLQTRGNIIIALECVKFWLPQVPSFHKLFKQREGAGREEVCLSFAYLKDVCFYVQLAKKRHSLLGLREPGERRLQGCQRKIIQYHYPALSVPADEVGRKGEY